MNHKKRNFKGVLSTFMVSALATSLIPNIEAQGAVWFRDVTVGKYYYTQVINWANKGVVKGTDLETYEFSPEKALTREEIAVILDTIMGYEVDDHISFTDYSMGNWSYDWMMKVANAGIVGGYPDGTIRYNTPATREEVAVMICNALHIDYADLSIQYTGFADDSSITWSKGAVNALVELGAIKGFPDDNTFRPTGSITRADFLVILNAVLNPDDLIDTSGSYSTNQGGMVVVNTDGVSLHDQTFYRSLVLAEGIADGDAYLTNVILEENLVIKGGGNQSIYLDNVDIYGDVTISRAKDAVRVVVKGGSKLPTIEIENDSIIDASELEEEIQLGDVTITGGAEVTLIGRYDSLTVDNEGVNVTLGSSTFGEITLLTSAVIDGVEYAAGDTVDNNVADFDGEYILPEIEITMDYGTSVADGYDPEAVVTVESSKIDSETGLITLELYVEDIDDCIRMYQPENAVSIYNPSSLVSLDAVEIVSITEEAATRTSTYTVKIQLEQNLNTLPLTFHLKSEDAEPEIVLNKNFNGISNASASVSVDEITVGNSTTTVELLIENIKNCEPHYLDELFVTVVNDEDVTISSVDYDEDDAEAYVTIKFDSNTYDGVTLDLNFLKVGAEDEICPLDVSFFYDDEEVSGTSYGSVKLGEAELNKYGEMEVEIIVDNLNLDKYQLNQTLTKAIDILAEKGEPEFGYGLDFGVTVTHSGTKSIYVISYETSEDHEEICFLVNLEDADEEIPDMIVTSNLVRLLSDDTVDYLTINVNSSYYSKSYVTVEVSIDEELLEEELEGYELGSDVVLSIVSKYDRSEDEDKDNCTNFSVSKVKDGLYEISFKPVFDDDDAPMAVYFGLDLAVKSDYVALHPAKLDDIYEESDGKEYKIIRGISGDNLPFAVEYDEESDTDTYSITFTTVTDTEYFEIIPVNEDYLSTDDDGELEYSWNCTSYTYNDESKNHTQKGTLTFTTTRRRAPETVAFYVTNVSDDDAVKGQTVYQAPSSVTINLGEGTDTIVATNNISVDKDTGVVTVTLDDFEQHFTFIRGDDSEIVANSISYDSTTKKLTFTLAETNSTGEPVELTATATSFPTVTFKSSPDGYDDDDFTDGTKSSKYTSDVGVTYSINVELPAGTTLVTTPSPYGFMTGTGSSLTELKYGPENNGIYTVKFTNSTSYMEDNKITITAYLKTAADNLSFAETNINGEHNLLDPIYDSATSTLTFSRDTNANYGLAWSGEEGDYQAHVYMTYSDTGIYQWFTDEDGKNDIDTTDGLGIVFKTSTTDSTTTYYASTNKDGSNPFPVEFVLKDAQVKSDNSVATENDVYILSGDSSKWQGIVDEQGVNATNGFQYFSIAPYSEIDADFTLSAKQVLVMNYDGSGTDIGATITFEKDKEGESYGVSLTGKGYLIYNNIVYKCIVSNTPTLKLTSFADIDTLVTGLGNLSNSQISALQNAITS